MSSSEVRRHNETVLKSLKRGDLVQFDRGKFDHWAVYVGDKQVVHLSGVNGPMASNIKHSGSLSGQEYDKGHVCKDGFWKVAGDSKACKNNSKDNEKRPLEPSEIVNKAESKIGEFGYNVIFKNCEHFASGCRYGEEQSDQVKRWLTYIACLVNSLAVVVCAGLTWLVTTRTKNQSTDMSNVYSGVPMSETGYIDKTVDSSGECSQVGSDRHVNRA